MKRCPLLGAALILAALLVGCADREPAPPGMAEPVVVASYEVAATLLPSPTPLLSATPRPTEAPATATAATGTTTAAPPSTPSPSPAEAPPTSSPVTATAIAAPSPTPSPSPDAPTAATLAEAGQPLYARHCASCHGAQGQGRGANPALIGEGARLAKYESAQGLLDYVTRAMPLGNPQTLSEPQHREVVAFLLLEDGWVDPARPLDEAAWASISLAP